MNTPNAELAILRLVCERLDSASIPYMVTGSIAMNLYATPRMTRDIDLLVQLKKEDSEKIVNLFLNDFYVDSEMIKESVEQESAFNIIHSKEILKVDFIIKRNDTFSETEFSRRRPIEIACQQIWVISAEDLILSKLLWARDSESEFQLRDVRNLVEGVQNLDAAYLQNWMKKLGLETLYEKAQK